ncbi:alpha/beta fold hydrolase [Plantactinospora sp. CA-290183]|uniref:alpha/beta fold hydrolase n=1 Tax=Plantactinospora sp. CA-290183 TaxID=3240006 RepID=UPI003D8A877A
MLVGHSGGGMPVQQVAQRVPARLARVVYLDSGPLPDGVAQSTPTRRRSRSGSGR